MDINKFIITHKNWDEITNKDLQLIFNGKKNYKQHNLYIDLADKDTKNSKQVDELIKFTETLYNNCEKFKDIYNKLHNEYGDFIKTLNKSEKILEYNGGIDYGLNCPYQDMFTQPRPSGYRIKNGKVFPTITKSGDGIYINKYKRKMTIKECLRLQSFPEDFKFNDKKKAFERIGNAVNVQVIEVFIRSIFQALEL